MTLNSVPIWRIVTSGSGNIDVSQNTKESALYYTNPSYNLMAYVKLNSEHLFLTIFRLSTCL